jgi:hypothetical protein
VTPILRVADTAASIHYYVTALGFHLDWQDPRVGFTSVSRGKCQLFLCRGDQDIRATGFGSASGTRTDCCKSEAVERKSVISLRITPGPMRWRWRISTETFCGSASNQRRMAGYARPTLASAGWRLEARLTPNLPCVLASRHLSDFPTIRSLNAEND